MNMFFLFRKCFQCQKYRILSVLIPFDKKLITNLFFVKYRTFNEHFKKCCNLNEHFPKSSRFIRT